MGTFEVLKNIKSKDLKIKLSKKEQEIVTKWIKNYKRSEMHDLVFVHTSRRTE